MNVFVPFPVFLGGGQRLITKRVCQNKKNSSFAEYQLDCIYY